jgi:hypothetical protein
MATDVTINEVRVALNNISTGEVTDDTILQKIEDVQGWMEDQGYEVTSRGARRFIRATAALRSFAISKTYSMLKQGDLQVKNEWELKLNELKADADDAWAEIIGSGVFISTSTPMFDDRPEDPIESGEDDNLE